MGGGKPEPLPHVYIDKLKKLYSKEIKNETKEIPQSDIGTCAGACYVPGQHDHRVCGWPHSGLGNNAGRGYNHESIGNAGRHHDPRRNV